MKKFFCIFLMILPGLVKSQVRQDSLYVNPQLAAIYDMTMLRHSLSDSAGFQYGRAGLVYDRSTGNYRRAQQAYKKDLVGFYAEGANSINKITISGNFSFNKSFEDSLSNSLRSDLDALSPYYYYASKASKYERQNYIANVTASYDLWRGRLFPFININYQTHWTTGSVDPRPDSKKFILKYNPGLTVKVKDRTTLGLMAIIGSSSEDISLDYKNRIYSQSLTFPERIHYINFGYGYSSIKDTSGLRKYTRHIGGELSVKQQLGSWKLLSYLRAERSLEKNTHETQSRKVYYVRSKFTLNQYSGRLLFTKSGNHHDQQLDIEAEIADGYDGHADFSYDLSIVNYNVSQNSLRVDYSLIFNKQQRNMQELGAGLRYYDEYREDAAQSTTLSAKQLSLTALYRSYFTLGNNSMLVAKIAPIYIFPVEAEVVTNPNSVTAFTRNVVYTDYYYFNSKLAGANMGLSWLNNKLLKKNILEFSVDVQYITKLNSPVVSYEAGFIPDRYRMFSNAGIKLFF